MTAKKILPNNLQAIKQHFEKQRTEIKNKLRLITKRKLELESELAVCEDGLAWCERVFGAGKKSD